MLAPALFAGVVALLTVVQDDFLRSVGWHPTRRSDAGWPSVLALGRYGWLQVANFAVSGLLAAAFAVGLARSLRGTGTTIGCALLAVTGVGLALEAFKPDAPSGSVSRTWHDEIHGTVFPVVVTSAIATAFVLALALRNEDGWRGYSLYSLLTAAVALATLPLQAEPAYGQLFEYVFFGSLLLWLELLAIRLWSISGRSAP